MKRAKEIVKRWGDFIIYLATLVASVFEPTISDDCLKEICAFNENGSPDKSCWRRALNHITLIAARFQFISLLVLPVDLRDRCIGKGPASSSGPVPITIQGVQYTRCPHYGFVFRVTPPPISYFRQGQTLFRRKGAITN